MRLLKVLSYTLILFYSTILSFGQSYKVIAIEGEAFTVNNDGSKNNYTKIVFGPLTDFSEIILKDKSSVKIINAKNEICDLKEEGSYPFADLIFIKSEDASVFDKFCDYFHSFFVNHSSAESKSYYKNSILAISRGHVPAPHLDFPLNGNFPNQNGAIPFVWSHACDSCDYIVTIYDYATRSSVFAWTTKEHTLLLDNSKKNLLPGKKYYWTVTLPGEELEYANNVFTITEGEEYANVISALESDLEDQTFVNGYLAKTVYILSELQALDQINYGIFYGLQQKDKYPDDQLLSNFVDRFWYDYLINEKQ